MDIQQIKQRFGIIGNSLLLDRAIDICTQVAPTDLSVLISGESGTGKEVIPQIIHQLSSRKHGSYIAVNCGAIPEGTIDSELFGHEKGAFTGATDNRKGYFEVANGGTIFLDETGELPLQSQVRLLRVLETGEYIKVGSAKVQKTDVRIIAATNVNIPEAIRNGRFREDLYYRLNTVPIYIPPLRERKDDIHLLFRKFAASHAEKYRMPTVRLKPDAVELLTRYNWPGNIRQLKNIAEQIAVIESERDIDAEILIKYLPDSNATRLPVLAEGKNSAKEVSEREILYKVLFDMKKDMTDLKGLVLELLQSNGNVDLQGDNADTARRIYNDMEITSGENSQEIREATPVSFTGTTLPTPVPAFAPNDNGFMEHEEVEESLSLEDREVELIRKALKKHRGKRKPAAKELGISERTLYRKIREYDIK